MTRSQKPRTAFDRKESAFAIKLILVCIGLFITSIAFSQATIDRTLQCSCIDNGAPTGFAQFEEEITVNSGAGEIWYIQSVSGFYNISSPVPPAAPVEFTIGPAGDMLSENATGVYTLSGLHQENLGYSITVTNGTETLSLSNILCAFPSSEIVGDNAVCGSEVITYSASNIDPNFTYAWNVISGGVIVGDADQTSVEVQWDDLPGEAGALSLEVTGVTGCNSTSFMTVEFEDDINLA